jgi:hypothetical protein
VFAPSETPFRPGRNGWIFAAARISRRAGLAVFGPRSDGEPGAAPIYTPRGKRIGFNHAVQGVR